MKIYAPVKDFNGWRNNIRFINGVGETDDTQLIEWFKSKGYAVENIEKCENHTENSLEKCDDSVRIECENCDEPDFEAMTPNELRDWARANGLGVKIKNTRNKEKLLEIIRG